MPTAATARWCSTWRGPWTRHAFGIRAARQPFEMVVGSEVLLDVELVLERA